MAVIATVAKVVAPIVAKEAEHVFQNGWGWLEEHKKTFHGIAAVAPASAPVEVVAPASQSASAPSAPSAPIAPAAPQAPAAPIAPIAPAAPVAASTVASAPASTAAPAGASSLLERMKAALGNDTSILAEVEKVLGGK